MLAGGDYLPDRRDRHLLDDSVDRGEQFCAREPRLGLRDGLPRFVGLAVGFAELVLVVGDELGEGLDLLAGDLLERGVGFDQFAAIGGKRGLRLLQLLLGVIEIDLCADLEIDRFLPRADALG